MGCGASKSNPDHNEVPARLRPVLWRRLEEIRARIAGGGGGALIRTDPSKQQPLIIEGSSDTDNHYYENNLDPTNPSCHQTQYCPPTLQKIVDDPTTSCKLLLDNKCDDHEEIIKGLVIEEDIHLCKNNKMDLDYYDGKVAYKEIEKEKGLDEMENEEVDELEMVGGASPSFKVYCRTDIDSISNLYDEDEYYEHAEVENVVDCQGISTGDESVSSNEVSVKHLPKKGTRGNKFKKMIPKGGKNMFSMQTLHNLPCSSNNSHDNSHLLQKAAA